MKRVRFEDPEEFIADCGVIFDRVLSRCFEEKQHETNTGRHGIKET